MKQIKSTALALILAGLLTGAAKPTTRPVNARAEGLRHEAGAVTFRLVYTGPVDKPFYSESWGPKPSALSMVAASPTVITAAQARDVTNWMERMGLLEDGIAQDPSAPLEGDAQRYLLFIDGKREGYRIDLGWGPQMVEQIQGMRKALGSGAGKSMKRLLERLMEDQKSWAEKTSDKKKARG